MLAKAYGAAVEGIDAQLVTLETSVTRGVGIQLVGMADAAVKESRMRVYTALEEVGYKQPVRSVLINLSPADLRKEGAGFDLPLAMSLMAAEGTINGVKLQQYLLVGELSLDGQLLPIKGALPIAIKARELGFKGLIVPKYNAVEAAVVDRLDVHGAVSLLEVIQFFIEDKQIEKVSYDTRQAFSESQGDVSLDFKDVKGQESVKRALEVAASGGHNVIMVGPPGAGKSMMAKRLPTILPPLSLGESLETTKIHSVAGALKEGSALISERPFRAPHHTISQVALAGGGHVPSPGELTLATNGVLFLDELPEFSRQALEVLRQPLEDRVISIARAKWVQTYPANFTLIAAMNPCPCGYYNHPTRECTCSPSQVQKYLNKISGPLLDRIDIQIEITPVPFEKLSQYGAGESSAVIRDRVVQARAIQEIRYKDYPGVYCNAQMTTKLLDKFATLDTNCLHMLQQAMERLNLSARAYDRIRRMARTIADLDASDTINPIHMAEAIGYRNLDRDTWGQ